MVEYTSRLDLVFSALADPIRRDILERVSVGEHTVNQIALEYDMSLAAVSKHLKVLFEAGLIRRRKDGRFIYVSLEPGGLSEIYIYTQQHDQTSDRLVASST